MHMYFKSLYLYVIIYSGGVFDMLNNIKLKIYDLLKEDDVRTGPNTIAEYFIGVMVCLNIVLIIFESLELTYEQRVIANYLRIVFFVFFLAEYILRLWISDIVMFEVENPAKACIKYMFTFNAIVNLLALLPVAFEGNFIDFRIFRVLRLLRLTQIKALKQYTDVLKRVLKLKGEHLAVSLVIAMTFSLICAVIIYDLEKEAQPEVFKNILDGLWWAISSMTTIGYGDMYPITPLGKLLGSFMSIFGVFLMGVPIGIWTSGFFEVSKRFDHEDKNS